MKFDFIQLAQSPEFVSEDGKIGIANAPGGGFVAFSNAQPGVFVAQGGCTKKIALLRLQKAANLLMRNMAVIEVACAKEIAKIHGEK